MPSIQIKVRLGASTKSFTGNKRLISLGRSATNDLVLPFPFLEDDHLVVENTARAIRVRAGSSEAKAVVDGKPLGLDWIMLPSPGRVEIPTLDGKRMVLDLFSTEPRLGAMILRDAEGTGGDISEGTSGLQMLGQSRFGSRESDEQGFATNDGGLGSADIPQPWWGTRRIAIPAVCGVYALLIIGALGFNRLRVSSEKQRVAADMAFVSGKIEEANGYVRNGQFAAAKSSLDAAEEVAKRLPQLANSLEDISRIRKKPEIQLGAEGFVKVGNEWVPEQTAGEIKSARERDDPKIAELERKASEALAAGKYDDARSADEEAIAIMKAETVQPHPREIAIAAHLKSINDRSTAAEMTSKGFVQYDGRWMLPDEKLKLEQEAKGLVLSNGEWMMREQAAESESKLSAGLVLNQGKWITPDQKMDAQGLVKFEGKWIKPSERDAMTAQRKTDDAQQKAAEARGEQLKKAAYLKSEEFLRKTTELPKSVTFQAFESNKVTVVEDQGWYIVQGVVTFNETTKPYSRTYYCKLRPKPDHADEWEAATTSFAP